MSADIDLDLTLFLSGMIFLQKYDVQIMLALYSDPIEMVYLHQQLCDVLLVWWYVFLCRIMRDRYLWPTRRRNNPCSVACAAKAWCTVSSSTGNGVGRQGGGASEQVAPAGGRSTGPIEQLSRTVVVHPRCYRLQLFIAHANFKM